MRRIFSRTLLLSLFGLLFANSGDLSLRAAGGDDLDLSAEECTKLFDHQLKIAATDNGFPLQPATSLAKKRLQENDIISAQGDRCVQTVSRRNYECQMKGKNMLDILQCVLRFESAYKISPPQVAPIESESPPELSGGNDDKPANGGVTVGNISIVRYEVNQQNCERAYDRLVTVYSRFPRLKEDNNAEKLVRYWQTPEARQSFSAKCTSVYKPSDLGCILSTEEPDVIQACLVQIPE